MKHKLTCIVIWWLVGLAAANAQTSSFTYQGRLTDGGAAASGNYDLQFTLWDSLSGGGQVGSTQTLNTVAVSNGVFTVSLDFGANAFNGASRFLEISARPSGGGAFTLLAPRQQITSTPYAVRSLNAATADNVPAATVINATTQYNLNGTRILAGGGFSLFAGENAGLNSTGAQNAFFGGSAGAANLTGSFNGFFGSRAGLSNTTGQGNSFFGESSGRANTTGSDNSFYGINSGRVATGSFNTFVGSGADFINISPSGNRNTLLGANAKILTGGMFSPDNATAIGANAQVDQANSLVLGSINGVNGATADTKVGIGTTGPTAKLSVIATGDGARVLHLGIERGWVFKQKGTGAATALELTGDDPANNNKNFVINTDGRVGIGTTVPQAKLHVAGPTNQDALIVSGTSKFDGGKAEFSPSTQVQVHGLTGGGSTAVCRDSSNFLSFCSSSLRYKKDVSRFGSGLDIISHLRPIAFTWKQDGIRDIGLAAEEVEMVEPLLTFRSNKGEIEGVKYDQLSAVLINAIKEQQAQIERQQQQIGEQRQQITGLKRLVCQSHRHAAVCK